MVAATGPQHGIPRDSPASVGVGLFLGAGAGQPRRLEQPGHQTTDVSEDGRLKNRLSRRIGAQLVPDRAHAHRDTRARARIRERGIPSAGLIRLGVLSVRDIPTAGKSGPRRRHQDRDEQHGGNVRVTLHLWTLQRFHLDQWNVRILLTSKSRRNSRNRGKSGKNSWSRSKYSSLSSKLPSSAANCPRT